MGIFGTEFFQPKMSLEWPEDQSFNEVMEDWRFMLDANRKVRRHPFSVFFVAKPDGMEDLLGRILRSLKIPQRGVLVDQVSRPRTVDFTLRTLQRENELKNLKGDTAIYVINTYQRALQGMNPQSQVNAAHNWTQGFLEGKEFRQTFAGKNIGVLTCIDGSLGDQAYHDAVNAAKNVETKSGLLVVR